MGDTNWSPDLYLRFQRERTQPSIDLAKRIDLPVRRALDAGCGPGNSTRVLRSIWPEAEIVGVDSSAEMIKAAEASDVKEVRWIQSDLRSYDPTDQFDLVFSNAVIQWIPDQPSLLSHLFLLVRPGGALAFQVPLYHEMPVRQAIRDTADSGPWSSRLTGLADALTFHEPGFYYDVLSELTDEVSIWETRYIHEMPSAGAIVEMMRSTGMRAYLRALDPSDHRAFLSAVEDRVTNAYPEQANGRVLFTFRRFFAIATKPQEGAGGP